MISVDRLTRRVFVMRANVRSVSRTDTERVGE